MSSQVADQESKPSLSQPLPLGRVSPGDTDGSHSPSVIEIFKTSQAWD